MTIENYLCLEERLNIYNLKTYINDWFYYKVIVDNWTKGIITYLKKIEPLYDSDTGDMRIVYYYEELQDIEYQELNERLEVGL
jgi:hypothetical protein